MKMKYTLSTIAFLAGTVGALASDLPSKSIPLPPTPIHEGSLPYFVGANIGSNSDKTRVYSGGISLGAYASEYLATEMTYDYASPSKEIAGKRDSKQTVAVNAVPQLPLFGTGASVYGLAGVGYNWDSISRDRSIYNVGGGVKYQFARNIELDTRYRHTDAIEKKDRNSDDRVTLGVNYKF